MHKTFTFRRAAGLGALLLLLGGCGTNSPTGGTSADGGAGTGEQPFVGSGAGTGANATPGPDPQTASRPGNEPLAAVPGPNDAADVASPPVAAPDSLHLLSPGRAGRLRLGMTEAELRKLLPPAQLRKTTRPDSRGVSAPTYFVQNPQDPAAPPLQLDLRGSPAAGYRVQQIRVMDPAYRTATGVGVGTPFGVARQQYGMSDLEKTDAGLVAASDQVKLAWVLDPNSLPDKSARNMRSSDVPPATRIVGVLVK